MKAVSPKIENLIRELMNVESLTDFSLGGGTNLAVKYAYRISTDIDLFSSDIVGLKKIEEIAKDLENKYTDCVIKIENNTSENLSFIRAKIDDVKIDIIQNIKLNHKIELIDSIRLINDLDIGALKLLSFADRGTRKDLYDLYFLSIKYGLERLYDELQNRKIKFDILQAENQNIFNLPSFKPKEDLTNSLTKLCDFNKLTDLKNSNNRVNLVKYENDRTFSLPVVEKKWIEMVKELAYKKGLHFEETPKTRIKRNRGFSF